MKKLITAASVLIGLTACTSSKDVVTKNGEVITVQTDARSGDVITIYRVGLFWRQCEQGEQVYSQDTVIFFDKEAAILEYKTVTVK